MSKLAIIDLSQIECRLLNTLAGQNDVVQKFRNGEDPYIGIASHFYGRAITKDDKFERGMGKQSELMCGYGCGAAKFRATAKIGAYGPPVDMSLEEATRFVQLYRQTHANVCIYWRAGEQILQMLYQGEQILWGPMQVKNK